MPANTIKSFADKSGKSVKEVEKLWDKAKKLALEKMSEDDDGYFAYVTGILKKMLSIEEETSSGAVAMPQGPLQNKMPCGTPYFDCDEDMFYSLHLKKRKDGAWFNKHYKDTDVADYARKNKGKGFYLKYNNMFRKIKAK